MDKAERLARFGGVTITKHGDDEVHATVTGDSGNDWNVSIVGTVEECTCPLYQKGHRTCAHIDATILYWLYGEVYAAEWRAQLREAARS